MMAEFLSDPVHKAFAVTITALFLTWIGMLASIAWDHRVGPSGEGGKMKLDNLHALVDNYLRNGASTAMDNTDWEGSLEEFHDGAKELLAQVETDLGLDEGTLSDCDEMTHLNKTVDDFYEREDAFVPGEDMDGDHESALASAGFGPDENYGSFGGDE